MIIKIRREFEDLFGNRRDLRIVQLLVQSGASITIGDEEGNTPLTHATEDEMKLVEGTCNLTNLVEINVIIKSGQMQLMY